MNSYSRENESRRRVARTQPWLGTYVCIGADGNDSKTHNAIDAAFADIARIHRSMSFQNPNSELSNLNRLAHQRPVEVSASVYRVLKSALVIAKASDGCFDPAIAGRLVQDGSLPPPNINSIDLDASWRDVVLLDGNRVEYARPLWLDLSGIAKGYAVDAAIRTLVKHGVRAATVNAGGDLRTYGRWQTVFVRDPQCISEHIALLELENGAVATSANYFTEMDDGRCMLYDADSREYLKQACSVTVTAKRAVWADALTKIVLARRQESIPLLKKLGASAMLIFPDRSRQQIN